LGGSAERKKSEPWQQLDPFETGKEVSRPWSMLGGKGDRTLEKRGQTCKKRTA